MNEELMTIKDFAAAAGISHQTVYKQMKKRLKAYVVTVENRKYIKKSALDLYATHATQVAQPMQPEKVSKNNVSSNTVAQPLQPDATENATSFATQKQLENQIEALQERLKAAEADKEFMRDQLQMKDRQIESLNENLKIAQQLAAADKQKLLALEAKQAEEPEATAEATEPEVISAPDRKQPERKRSILSRIFRR